MFKAAFSSMGEKRKEMSSFNEHHKPSKFKRFGRVKMHQRNRCKNAGESWKRTVLQFFWRVCMVNFKEPVSPKVLCALRYNFHIWKIRHFLDCHEVWFVPSFIAAVSGPKALVWILTWPLSVAISISMYISEFWSVFAVEKEIFKLDTS